MLCSLVATDTPNVEQLRMFIESERYSHAHGIEVMSIAMVWGHR